MNGFGVPSALALMWVPLHLFLASHCLAFHLRERIFDRFYRSPEGEARATAGTGIGLSISRSLARLHGGELRVAPWEEPGIGSR